MSQKQSGGTRALEIIVGILMMILSVVVIIYPGIGIGTLIILLSVALLFGGVWAIYMAAVPAFSTGTRVLSAIWGILALILSLVVLLSPTTGAATLVLYLAYGLIFYGIGRLYLAYALKASPTWVKAGSVAVGLLCLIAAFVVIAYPGIALLTLAAILAIGLFVGGVESLVVGAAGRRW